MAGGLESEGAHVPFVRALQHFPFCLAFAHLYRGVLAVYHGDSARAFPLLERALALARQQGMNHAAAQAELLQGSLLSLHSAERRDRLLGALQHFAAQDARFLRRATEKSLMLVPHCDLGAPLRARLGALHAFGDALFGLVDGRRNKVVLQEGVRAQRAPPTPAALAAPGAHVSDASEMDGSGSMDGGGGGGGPFALPSVTPGSASAAAVAYNNGLGSGRPSMSVAPQHAWRPGGALSQASATQPFGARALAPTGYAS